MRICDCLDPQDNGAKPTCLRCGFTLATRPWDLTPDAMRAFFKDMATAAPDLKGVIEHGAYLSISRAFSDQAVSEYSINGFHDRDLNGEAQDELIDGVNYQIFEALKNIRALEHNVGDPVKTEEEYYELLAIAVDLLRVHQRIAGFYAARQSLAEEGAHLRRHRLLAEQSG